MLRTKTTVLLTVSLGVLLELGIHALSGRREAWDSPQYWTIGLPVVALASAALGACASRKDWLWSLAIVPSQVLTMTIRRGELGGLWPLTVALSSVLSAPFVVASFAGSRLRKFLW